MSLASQSRQHAQDWFRVAERLPAQDRQSALNVAEAWFRLAMDAEAMDAKAIKARQPTNSTIH